VTLIIVAGLCFILMRAVLRRPRVASP